MPRKRLTDEGVAKLKPPPTGKQVDYYDTHLPGLVLRVNYGGAKIWRALHYVKRTGKNGKQVSIPTTYKLGPLPGAQAEGCAREGRPVPRGPAEGQSEGRHQQFQASGRERPRPPRQGQEVALAI